MGVPPTPSPPSPEWSGRRVSGSTSQFSSTYIFKVNNKDTGFCRDLLGHAATFFLDIIICLFA